MIKNKEMQRTARHPVFSLLVSQGIGQVFMLVGALSVAVLFSEAEIGDFSIFFSFVMISTSVAALRLEWAIVNATPEMQLETFGIALMIAVFISVLATGVFLALSLTAIEPFNFRLIAYAPLVFGSVLFGAAGQLCLYTMVAQQAYNRLAWFNFFNQALRAILPILLVVTLARDPYLMGAGELLARVAVFAIFVAPYATKLRAVWREVNWASVRNMLWTHRKFITISTPSSLVDAISASLMPFLIGARFGIAAAGAVWFAQRVLAFPVSLSAKAVGDYLHGRLRAMLVQDDLLGARRLFLKMTLVLAAFSCLLLLGATLLTPQIGKLSFTSQWSLALSITPYIAVLSAAFLMSAPLSRVILITNRQEKKLVYDVFSLCAALAAFGVTGYLSMPIEKTVLSIAAAQAFAALVYVRISYHALDKTAEPKPIH